MSSSAAEINDAFYRLPEEKTFIEWRKTAPFRVPVCAQGKAGF